MNSVLKKLFEINSEVPNILITNTLINVYYYYMKARFYKLDEQVMNDCLSTLKEEKWMQLWLSTGENWMDVINNIKPGQVYDDQYVIFFKNNSF